MSKSKSKGKNKLTRKVKSSKYPTKDTTKDITKNKIKTRKNRIHKSFPYPKINIKVDWNSEDAGYSQLTSKRVFNFLSNELAKGNNLLQTQDDKPFYAFGETTLHLQAKPYRKWPIKPNWERGVMCKKYNDWIKTNPCRVGKKRAKIFLKIKSNRRAAGFAAYLLALFSGCISLGDHKDFVKALKSTFHKNPILLHNEDMDWVHMKQADKA